MRPCHDRRRRNGQRRKTNAGGLGAWLERLSERVNALHLKLNEIVAAIDGASNRLIEVEDLTEHELEILRKHYRKRARLAKRSASVTESHSVEEAERRHTRKLARGEV